MNEFADLLANAASGCESARDELLVTIYQELRELARGAMRHERPDHTLQPSALVNEAWLRLSSKPATVESRAQFLRMAARCMREILVDHARGRRTEKRGGTFSKAELHEPAAVAGLEPETLLAVDSALEKLGTHDARGRQVVELRFFAGLTIEETAQVLHLAPKTVMRDWNFARAWLEKEFRS